MTLAVGNPNIKLCSFNRSLDELHLTGLNSVVTSLSLRKLLYTDCDRYSGNDTEEQTRYSIPIPQYKKKRSENEHNKKVKLQKFGHISPKTIKALKSNKKQKNIKIIK
ncbi:hypothetical protein NL108_018184 [Boleophthalmus pectinirostris]|nr:hypothetical protein NL108_018184 [Boleophthalmus pectinirostris]